MTRRIDAAKAVAILGFLVMLSTTYYLRADALTLNSIRFSADNIRAEYEIQRLKATYPERLEQHKVESKNYELQEQHYREMSELYHKDYEAYIKRIKDQYQPPQLPARPARPDSPEVQEELSKINAQFRAEKYRYFRVASILNGTAWAAAMLLVGGLLFLLMFDVDGQRWYYVVVLGLSFTFMIGPSFHSILSAIIGFLSPPSVNT